MFCGCFQASLHGNVEVVQFLLKNGVNAASKDLLGLTAVDIAEKIGLTEVAKILNSMSQTDNT